MLPNMTPTRRAKQVIEFVSQFWRALHIAPQQLEFTELYVPETLVVDLPGDTVIHRFIVPQGLPGAEHPSQCIFL